MVRDIADETLALNVKEKDDNSSLEELIRRHSNICYKMVHGYSSKANSFTSFDELIKEKDYIIYKAAQSFTPSASKFSTWLANQTRYFCLNQYNRSTKTFAKEERIADYLNIKYNGYVDDPEFLGEKAAEFMGLIKQMKDPRIETIFKRRFFNEDRRRTWKEIGSEIHMSYQGALNLYNKGLEYLRKNAELA